jgi:hypothetical protein
MRILWAPAGTSGAGRLLQDCHSRRMAPPLLLFMLLRLLRLLYTDDAVQCAQLLLLALPGYGCCCLLMKWLSFFTGTCNWGRQAGFRGTGMAGTCGTGESAQLTTGTCHSEANAYWLTAERFAMEFHTQGV